MLGGGRAISRYTQEVPGRSQEVQCMTLFPGPEEQKDSSEIMTVLPLLSRKCGLVPFSPGVENFREEVEMQF